LIRNYVDLSDLRYLIHLLQHTPNIIDSAEWEKHDTELRSQLKRCIGSEDIRDFMCNEDPTNECPDDATVIYYHAAKIGVRYLKSDQRKHLEECGYCQSWFLFYVHELQRDPTFAPPSEEMTEEQAKDFSKLTDSMCNLVQAIKAVKRKSCLLKYPSCNFMPCLLRHVCEALDIMDVQ
jgi:hypothetical protein